MRVNSDKGNWESWSTYVLTTLGKLDSVVVKDCANTTKFRENYIREILEIRAELRKEIRDLNEFSISPLKTRLAVMSIIFGGLSGCAFSIFTALTVHGILSK
jgi:hypothetical protein